MSKLFFMESVELNEDKTLHVVFKRKSEDGVEMIDIPKMEIRGLNYDGMYSTSNLIVFPCNEEFGYSIKITKTI